MNLTGIEGVLVLAEQYERVVAPDATASLDGLKLQLTRPAADLSSLDARTSWTEPRPVPAVTH